MMDEDLSVENLTVAIPTYNRLEYLTKLLKTIPEYVNTFVSDNGAFLPLEFRRSFKRVKFIQQSPVLDVIPNWNKCIEQVKTEWFMLPSDDDLYYIDSFKIIKKYITEYSDADLLIFGHRVIDKDDNEISRWVPEKKMEFLPPAGYEVFKYGVESRFPSMVFRTSKVRECGNLDESYKITAADSKMIQKVLLSGKVIFIPEIVGGYRTWPQNSTTLTLGTPAWLKEIDRWQNDIEAFIGEDVGSVAIGDFQKIKDEVYARNMLGGIVNIKKTQGKRWKYISENRFPRKASFLTKLKIIKAMLTI